MWLKVTQIGEGPIWSVKWETRLRYQTTGSVQLLLCLFLQLACSYRSVKWKRACLELAVRSVKALFRRWLFIRRISDLLFSMPSSFLYVILLFLCNVLKYLDYIQDMPFQCALDVVYVSSPYGLFKSRKI